MKSDEENFPYFNNPGYSDQGISFFSINRKINAATFAVVIYFANKAMIIRNTL